jgi:hypothetical protein
MNIVYREVKVTNGDGVNIPDSRIGEINIAQREDGAYIYWMEYAPRAGPIVNEEART